MGVKMIRWRPWPPLASKRFEVKLVVRKLESPGEADLVQEGTGGCGGASVEIRWKGPPRIALSSFGKTVKRNCTREERFKNGQDGAVFVEWDEEFQSECSLSSSRDNLFHPWEISFTVLLNRCQGTRNKAPTFGTTSVNLAEFAAKTDEKEFDINVPLVVLGCSPESCPHLSISLSLLELGSPQEPIESSSTDKTELSALKSGLRNVKILSEYVSTRKAKKACREYPFDSESLDELEGSEEDFELRKSFSYGTLADVNHMGVSLHSNRRVSVEEDEDFVYYSNRRSDVGPQTDDQRVRSVPEGVTYQSSKRGSILPWRKRKLSSKGEPLLKKDYGEEGGDDIDFDRRQLSSDESVSFECHKGEEESVANRSSVSDFGEDGFCVGSWERREIASRDGSMRLQAHVFFASIDQRSERAARESACTALVAVVADWLQCNRDLAGPIKSQFDALIREGSSAWRALCRDETCREAFPDGHFDLDTVLRAKIRPLSVLPENSFVGFFHPDNYPDDGSFEFLRGAMSFDDVWDEISRADVTTSHHLRVYIVSWNDHFFVLKVEPEAYYIIDTLGERLYEGCNEAYVLRFDKDTRICSDKEQEEEEESVLCEGKESCRDYIKKFLAAIPIRELEADVKKGLVKSSTPLHHRLQIEFHFTCK
ncbi:unnamed protein product [Cuscuta campestris]|uniref:C2 NT-type domain-containing protein n=1 Tax=Cuscuta campestris TaxID=132261 RepID=A0A484LV78_9ASTE|nr:unnamed protein product [Cuscuta campestris]